MHSGGNRGASGGVYDHPWQQQVNIHHLASAPLTWVHGIKPCNVLRARDMCFEESSLIMEPLVDYSVIEGATLGVTGAIFEFLYERGWWMAYQRERGTCFVYRVTR